MPYTNYHTHSLFCDGSAEPEEYIVEAIKKNIISLGFSSHAPIPIENKWSMKYERLDEYRQTIRSLQEKYKNEIDIFLGLEIDYIPEVTTTFDEFRKKIQPDYVIGAVHLIKKKGIDALWFIDGPENNYHEGLIKIFNGDIRLAVTTYYNQLCEMLFTQKPDIIAHFDKVKMYNRNKYFQEDEKWYLELIDKILNAIKQTGVIVEVNTRGIYKKKSDSLYPNIKILKECFSKKIPVTISADAHQPTELTAYFDETIQTLKDIGFKTTILFADGKWVEKML